MQEPYSAAIRWDEEARVWYVSETNFPGLAAEAETQQGLMEKIRLLIPELHDANRHLMQTHSHDAEIAIQLTTMHQETIKLAAASRRGVHAERDCLQAIEEWRSKATFDWPDLSDEEVDGWRDRSPGRDFTWPE